MSWRDRAACVGTDADIWFPPRQKQRRQAPGGAYDRARAFCVACPVRGECLTEALRLEGGRSHIYRSGMWGGVTPYVRWKMDRKRV